jgi:hypothetical protein
MGWHRHQCVSFFSSASFFPSLTPTNSRLPFSFDNPNWQSHNLVDVAKELSDRSEL